ncbi:MAG: NHL repeat-containing protein [Victivallales bacterium]|jgi:DNA-binding beta-propeller fold protein YncE
MMQMKHLLFSALMLACVCAVSSAAEEPSLQFEKIIGDIRGKCSDNVSVAVADDGTTCLLMKSGHVSIFDRQGKYLKSMETEFPWPAEFHYISAKGRLVLQGSCTQDYSWVYSATRKGSQPGSFNRPGLVVEDDAGTVYVADTGNKRVQVFPKGKTASPSCMIPVASGPVQLAVKDRLLSVASEDGSFTLFELQGDVYAPIATLKTGQAIRALAFGPESTMFVAQADSLKKFTIEKGVAVSIKESGTVAVPRATLWPSFFPGNGPMISGPDGEIYFAAGAHDKLISLKPGHDSMRERGNFPKNAKALAFAPDGTILTSSVKGKEVRLQRFKLGDGKLEDAGTFPAEPLYDNPNVPVWGLLSDTDGSVYMRIVEEGHNKGWPGLSIKKISPDGKIKTLLDYKESLYGKWTTFAPWEAYYSLKFDNDHNIVFASTQLLAISKVTTDGKVIWRSGTDPQGGGEKIEFSKPCDLAVDKKGNVWVADSGKDCIFCLSPEGKLLMSYGKHAGIDDTEGAGFSRPSGVSIASVDGAEFLYVGDSGNQRIVKFKIIHR